MTTGDDGIESRERRSILKGAAATAASYAFAIRSAHSEETKPKNADVLYGQETLPIGIRSRFIDTHNGTTVHILEAGFDTPGARCVVLLHGFPELAYYWRNQLLPLARAGFHVIAPDHRGYGRSVSTPVSFDDDLQPYSLMNRVGDVVGMVRALGYEKVALVVGHDWGAPTAQWCARLRPDIFESVVSVSNPFYRSLPLPLGSAKKSSTATTPAKSIDEELAALPRPRKHYAPYYASRAANDDMWHAPQGVHDLLRGLFHFKSADWEGNRPFPLKGWTASELAKMPTYYIMDRNKGVAETVAEVMPSKAQIAACRWMTEKDLKIYSDEFTRTGFQGGLNYYRIDGGASLAAFSGRTIDVPACYIGGEREWAVYQLPGAFEAMPSACTRLMGVHLVSKAGHSLAEEQPEEVNRLLINFLRQATA